jgi:glycosyltransferase involved in cell wall biosynthesis
MKVTVFTPTYNRAHLLSRVYTSLCNQTFTDFEWVLVDDGSSDDTKLIVESFINANKFPIIYLYQINKGKHFAINKGLKIANGDFFLILDSDDELPNGALDVVDFYITKCKKTPLLGGISGRRNYADGTIVGNSNFNELITNTLNIRYKYGVTGDLVEIYKTEVLREYPFPEIENEKFCPEDLIWNRIARKYDLLFFNKGIYTTQYLPDGLTAKIVKIRMTSPIASMLTYSELGSYTIPFIQKIKANINFWRFAFNSKQSFGYKWQLSKRAFMGLLIPIGFLMYCRDKTNKK